MRALTTAAFTLAILTASAVQAADHRRAYRYQAEEVVGAHTQSAHRMDFRLTRAPDGSLQAVVLAVAVLGPAGEWKPIETDDACRQAMRAPDGALAQVTLWPPASGDDPLGSSFLNDCAPADLFYSLTDVLNVAIIPIAPQFRAAALRRPGDVVRWPGFTARFARYGRRFEEAAPGGHLGLASWTPNETVVDWSPDPAHLQIEDSGSPPSRLEGEERWAFRVGFDTRTATLLWAQATTDEIDLDVHVQPNNPKPVTHVSLTRRVRIGPAANF